MRQMILKLGLVMTAALSIPAFAQDSISPPTFSAVIPVGTAASVIKTITIGKQIAPVDVMFVVDATGSMEPSISAIATDFSHTVTTIAGFASNVEFGLANYLDASNEGGSVGCPSDPWAYQVNQALTTSTSAVQTALNAVALIPSNGYGCDIPESGINALYLAATTTPWRAGSTRIIVWVGDAPSHTPDVIVVSSPGSPIETITQAQATSALQAAGVIVIAASATTGPGLDAACPSTPGCDSSPTPGNEAMQITAATGGQDLGSLNPSTPSTLTTPIENAITNAIAMYTSVGLGASPPSGLSLGIPTAITGTYSRAAVNTFVFPAMTILGLVPGVYNFSTLALLNGTADPGVSESDSITVTAVPPTIVKSFSPVIIAPGGTSRLTLTISNTNAAGVGTVGVVDALPPGVLVATPNGVTNTCGGTVTAIAGSGVVSLAGGTIAANSTCTITLVVTSNEGIKVNTTNPVTSAFGTGNAGTATLTAASPATISKAFGLLSIPVGSSTTLSFTVTNPNSIVTLTGLAFSDTLPSGLIVATPNGLTGSCGGGTITAVAGTSSISLSGASLAAGASCTFTVEVAGTGPGGLQTNTTSTITSNQSGPGAPATASIFVGDPYQVNYTSNLNIGNSFVNITNTGAGGAGLSSGTTASITGSICANVYVFDASEEILSCCSCPVTPNGLVSLSAQADLIGNPLTNANHNSIVIKLLATAPVAGSCSNSALLAGGPSLILGMAAWGTSLHANSTETSGYDVTEKPFSDSALSAGEFARLAYMCGVVANVGSGFGVCSSCRLGGLGAAAQ